MPSPFEFDEKVAIEAILFIAVRLRQPTFHRIAKLFYFADKAHLAQYGRFICGDHYIAMKHGPVPSGVYDLLKAVKNGYFARRYPHLSLAFQVEQGHCIKPLRHPNLEWLSDSEMTCLQHAIDRWGAASFAELTHISHDTAWLSVDENDEIGLDAIVTAVGAPVGLLEHLTDPHP